MAMSLVLMVIYQEVHKDRTQSVVCWGFLKTTQLQQSENTLLKAMGVQVWFCIQAHSFVFILMW